MLEKFMIENVLIGPGLSALKYSFQAAKRMIGNAPIQADAFVANIRRIRGQLGNMPTASHGHKLRPRKKGPPSWRS